MNKVLLPLLTVWPGIFLGAMIGAWIFHAWLGTGGHMDASGLVGAFIGMPVGGILSVYAAFVVGRWVDRRSGSKLTPARLGRIAGLAIAGCVAGILASVARIGSPEFLGFAGGWCGATIGCAWNVMSALPKQGETPTPGPD